MLMNRVKQVKALPGYRLALVFRSGEHGVFDCTPYRGYECLAGIWNNGVFDKVVADHGTVMWPNGADLCPDEVYDLAQKDGEFGVSSEKRTIVEDLAEEFQT